MAKESKQRCGNYRSILFQNSREMTSFILLLLINILAAESHSLESEKTDLHQVSDVKIFVVHNKKNHSFQVINKKTHWLRIAAHVDFGHSIPKEPKTNLLKQYYENNCLEYFILNSTADAASGLQIQYKQDSYGFLNDAATSYFQLKYFNETSYVLQYEYFFWTGSKICNYNVPAYNDTYPFSKFIKMTTRSKGRTPGP